MHDRPAPSWKRPTREPTEEGVHPWSPAPDNFVEPLAKHGMIPCRAPRSISFPTLAPPGYAPTWSRLVLNALPLFLADLAALSVAFAFAFTVNAALGVNVTSSFTWLMMLTGLILPLTFALFGLYPGTGLNAVAELAQVALATTLLFSILLISARLDGVETTIVLSLFAACLCLPAAVSLFRAIARTLASSLPWWGQPVLVFGSGETAQHLYNYYLTHPNLGIRPIAIIDHWPLTSPEGETSHHNTLPDRVEALHGNTTFPGPL